MLSQYYVSSVPAEVMRAVAEDWHEGLSRFPAWAIQQACRWWIGESNQSRHRKPLVGDIAARAHREMEMVRVGEIALRLSRKLDEEPAPNDPIDLEERRKLANEILQQAGYRMAGGEE